MKLSCLVEATLKDIERRIPIFLQKHYRDIPSDQATKLIEQLAALDPTRGKYTEWIIRQHNNGAIRIPEDSEKITRLLKQFHRNKQQLSDKDINNYTPGGLAKALDQIGGTSKRQAKKKGRAGKLALPPGAEQVLDKPPYQIVKITDAKASTIICSGTEWCTANLESAESYLEGGPLYVIYKNGDRYALAHAKSDQVMDVYDEPYEGEESKRLLKLLVGIDLDFGYMYAIESGERVPEVEPTIMKDPQWACWYARDIIKGRWLEAEPIIAKSPTWAYNYARDVIKGEWPEAEPFIAKSPTWAYNYARDVIKGRWPEAEPIIMRDPKWAHFYARDVIKGRWPEAEPIIMSDSWWAREYVQARLS